MFGLDLELAEYVMGDETRPLQSTSGWRENKTVLERNKFFASTTLAGFGFIQKSNSRVEIAIWYIVIIVFVGITVSHTKNLVVQYLAGNTVTSVSMHKLNDTLDVGVFRLGVKLVQPEFNIEYAHGFFFRSQYESYGGMTELYNRSLADEVNEALAKLDSREKMLGYTDQWDYVLLPLLSRYAAFFTMCEMKNENCTFPLPFEYTWEHETFTDDALLPVKNEIDKVLRHAKLLNITEQELVQQLGHEVLRRINFIVEKQQVRSKLIGIWGTYNQPKGNVLFVFDIKLDEPIPVGPAITMIADLSWYIDIATKSGTFTKNDTRNQVISWYKQHGPEMLVQFGGFNSRKRTISSDMGHISYWNLEVSQSFHGIVNCFKDNSNRDCVYDCAVKQVQKACNCTPRLLPLRLTNGLPCSVEHYFNCPMLGNRHNLLVNCTGNCKQDCDINFMDVQLTSQSATDPARRNEFYIAFDVLSNQYPTFLQDYATTWATFLADLGGTFDFWLGASVISLIHLLVYIFKQFVYMFGSETKTGKDVRNFGHKLRAKSHEEDPWIHKSHTLLQSELRNIKEQMCMLQQAHQEQMEEANQENNNHLYTLVRALQQQVAELKNAKLGEDGQSTTGTGKLDNDRYHTVYQQI